MTPKQTLGASIIVFCTALFSFAGKVQADGVVQNAGKDMVKGAVKGAQQEINAGDVTRGAKQITKGVLDGAADEAPLITSQLATRRT